ncbi:hypothetical protein D3C71_2106750 [compost metagenome]
MQVAQGDFAVLDLVVLANHENKFLRLVCADGRVVHQNGVGWFTATDLDARVQARQQSAVGIIETRTDADGS